MKQNLLPEQTAKLIELGFEKPKSEVECDLPKGGWRIGAVGIRKAYSIGELIEMLDSIPNNMWNFIKTSDRIVKVEMYIFPKTQSETYYYDVCYRKELIDALFVIIVKLKETGVI